LKRINKINVLTKVIPMPKLTKLTEDEYTAPTKLRSPPKRMSQRERTHRRYIRYLQPFAKGAYVEVTLRPGEKKQTEKNRLKRAADELGLTLVFKRTKGKIRFEVKK